MKLSYEAWENLKYLMKTYGNDKQKDFAKYVGITPSDYSKFINPDLKMEAVLKKICDKFQINENDFREKFLFEKNKIFASTYFGYFINRNDRIDKAQITINEESNKVIFNIILKKISNKEFEGKLYIDEDFFSFNLLPSDARAKNHSFINLRRPKIKQSERYIGGLGLFLESAINDRVPSVKKIIVSNVELDRDNQNDLKFLIKYLEIKENSNFLILSETDDTNVFEYIKDRFIKMSHFNINRPKQ